MNRRALYILSLVTIFGFSYIGFLIVHYYLKQPFLAIFEGAIAWYWLVLIGAVYGLLAALLGWKVVTSPPLKPTRKFYVKLIRSLNLKPFDIILVSFCAGVGEEILFRGAVQPLLGLWLTAIIFVAIHGYLNPMNWRMSLYGIYMTFVVAGMGFLAKELGIVAAISAHFVVDVVLLKKLTSDQAATEEEPPEA